MKKEEKMIKLNPSFQKETFEKVVDHFGSSLKASKKIRIPASSIRGYKNLYFDSVPEEVIKLLIDEKIIKKQDVKLNKLYIFNKNDVIERSMKRGREIRNKNILKMKNRIPSIKQIRKKNHLDVEMWLNEYKHITNLAFRKLKITKEKYNLIVSYNNYTKKGLKKFEVCIPKKIILNGEFIYFLGLWCGDKSGKGRFGVINKDKKIIEFVGKFLKRYNQRIERVLYIEDKLLSPEIYYDKRVEHRTRNGWALSVHSINGILSSFFYYLQSQLDSLLNTETEIYAFLAGLFDAEGNVSLYNKSFRWACGDEKLVHIYTNYFKKINIYDRYDGGCLVSYNKEKFYNEIYPYLKNKEKANLVNILCRGLGNLPENHLIILNYIRKNPNSSVKEITKALKKNKVYSELKILSDFGFLSKYHHPYRYKITNKGLKSLGD